MSKSAAALAKPTPAPKVEPRTVHLVTRVTPANRDAIKALADAEGISIQQLGMYAWSLALAAYGKPPLTETEASR